MDKVMSKGRTYQTKLQGMLYHTTHVHMLGAKVCRRSVEREVRDTTGSALCRREHSEKYSCQPNGEIQSEGIGIDEAVSIEGASAYFKPSNFRVCENDCQ